MDAALVNPFIEETLHIFETTVLVKSKPKLSFLKKKTETEDVSRHKTGQIPLDDAFSEKNIENRTQRQKRPKRDF